MNEGCSHSDNNLGDEHWAAYLCAKVRRRYDEYAADFTEYLRKTQRERKEAMAEMKCDRPISLSDECRYWPDTFVWDGTEPSFSLFSSYPKRGCSAGTDYMFLKEPRRRELEHIWADLRMKHEYFIKSTEGEKPVRRKETRAELSGAKLFRKLMNGKGLPSCEAAAEWASNADLTVDPELVADLVSGRDLLDVMQSYERGTDQTALLCYTLGMYPLDVVEELRRISKEKDLDIYRLNERADEAAEMFWDASRNAYSRMIGDISEWDVASVISKESGEVVGWDHFMTIGGSYVIIRELEHETMPAAIGMDTVCMAADIQNAIDCVYAYGMMGRDMYGIRYGPGLNEEEGLCT